MSPDARLLIVVAWLNGLAVGCAVGLLVSARLGRWLDARAARRAEERERLESERLAERWEALGCHADAARMRTERLPERYH